MNNIKINPIGIDVAIQGIQENLYSKLLGWDLEGFGRAELLEKKPVVFHLKNDYKPVLKINQLFKGRFFFIDDETTKTKYGQLSTKVDLIFLLDVKRIKPAVEHRADEEVRIEIYNILENNIQDREFDIVKGAEALKGFETDLVDLQPYHFIKYSFDLEYNPKENQC